MMLPHQILRSKISINQKIPIEEYEKMYDIDGWQVETLGQSEHPGLYLHGMSYGDKSKPCIFAVATVHGDEQPASYGLLEFARTISNPKSMLPNPEYIYNLRRKYSFYFIPVGNPWGYANDSRNNPNGVDLNRDYGPFTQRETRVIRDAFNSIQNVVLFLDCHDVGRSMDHQALGYNWNDYRSIFISTQVVKSMRVITGRKTSLYTGGYFDTMAPMWAGSHKSVNGSDVLAFYTEAYRGDSVQEEAYYTVNLCYWLSLHFDIYTSKSVLNPCGL